MLKFSFSLLVLLISLNTLQAQQYSELWGKDGEKWKPDSRLPDFSYAGYHCGEDPIPRIRGPILNVTKFGARGDGKTDCTKAIIRAIESIPRGVVYLPEGKYLISDIIWIKKPFVVLRGAGRGKTIIYPTKELEDVRPNMGATTSGKPTSNYSWSGGFIWVRGGIRGKSVGEISSETKRGDKKISIARPKAPLRPGQWVSINMIDDSKKTLLSHIYSGDPSDTKKITKPMQIQMANRVVSARGTAVILERPIRFDIKKDWKPELRTFEPQVSEVGIEDLTIEFPVKPYPGHTFQERGLNGIAMNGCAHCWVKNVQISNSDSGIYLSGIFCQAENILIDSKRRPGRGTTGHHGIQFGNECLVKDFDFKTHFVHDFTVCHGQAGNVVKNGRGINLSLDHHKKAPFENLFCNLDAGSGGELWRCGGGRSLGKHCGARGTFWCIKSKNHINYPHGGFGPVSMNLVGLKTKSKPIKDLKGKWFETMPPEKLQPADLHEAQLKKRLKGRK